MRYPIGKSLAALTLAAFALTPPAVAVPPIAQYVNESDLFEEADFVNLQFPHTLSLPTSTGTGAIYGRIYEDGITDNFGADSSIVAQLGYGPAGSDPFVNDALWTWLPASFNIQVGNDDEYVGSFTTPAVPGTYWYTFRFNTIGGGSFGWTLADRDGAGSNVGLTYNATYDNGATPNLGVLVVYGVPSPSAAALASLAGLVALRRRR